MLKTFKGSQNCYTVEGQPRQLTETQNKRRGEERGREGGREERKEGRRKERKKGGRNGGKKGRKFSLKIKATRDPEDPALLTQHAQVTPWVLSSGF